MVPLQGGMAGHRSDVRCRWKASLVPIGFSDDEARICRYRAC